jgi:hypothetical protein
MQARQCNAGSSVSADVERIAQINALMPVKNRGSMAVSHLLSMVMRSSTAFAASTTAGGGKLASPCRLLSPGSYLLDYKPCVEYVACCIIGSG